MATVNSKEIVDEIIANNGMYGSDEDGWDPPVIRIVRYNNMFDGGIAYGLVYEGEDPNRYHTSGACLNPTTVFERK